MDWQFQPYQQGNSSCLLACHKLQKDVTSLSLCALTWLGEESQNLRQMAFEEGEMDVLWWLLLLLRLRGWPSLQQHSWVKVKLTVNFKTFLKCTVIDDLSYAEMTTIDIQVYMYNAGWLRYKILYVQAPIVHANPYHIQSHLHAKLWFQCIQVVSQAVVVFILMWQQTRHKQGSVVGCILILYHATLWWNAMPLFNRCVHVDYSIYIDSTKPADSYNFNSNRQKQE